MIAKLQGLVDSLAEDSAIIDVNGVGYLVFASSRTLAKLPRGNEVSLWIETVVREDSISLYGFFHPLEKEWFLTLTKVQGVGARVCLAILSVLTPAQIAQAIAAQDKASFTRANGVGPKLAARIVTELKDKMVSLPTNAAAADFVEALNSNEKEASVVGDADNSKIEDAISALVNLGYARLEAYRVVNIIAARQTEADVGSLIRLALKEFAGKEG